VGCHKAIKNFTLIENDCSFINQTSNYQRRKKMARQKWDSKDIEDQKGRVSIVTGSSSGIGYETARVLAMKNATVIIAVRNIDKGKKAADQIRSEYPKADLEIMELGRRLEKTGNIPIVAAAHPGWTATELQRHAGGFRFLNPVLAQDIFMGALPMLYAAVGPDVKSGDYFGPAGFMEMRGYPKKVKSNNLSKDAEIAQKLWKVSEELTGAEFKV
jgi:hypothetical protein